MSLKELHSAPGHLIRRAYQITVALFLEECGDRLRPGELAVLAALDDFAHVDQITLAGMIAIDRASASRFLENLENNGLVRRWVSADDKRTKNVEITKKGKALLTRVGPSIANIQKRLLEPLTKGERECFVACLEKIAEVNNKLSRAPRRDVADEA
jgi:DNA-binding MarR family transcriptional regulator